MLQISDVHLSIDGNDILRGLSLSVPVGQVHAIMGPNGSGKSTLSYAIAGRENYRPQTGDIVFNGTSLLDLEPEARAAAGVFLSFQSPVAIPGVATMNFIRTALNAQRAARGEAEISAADFLAQFRAKAEQVGLSAEKLKRPFNDGYSGGERKRMEMLQLSLFAPQLAVMDETDSGLDIDALKMVGEVVNDLRDGQRSFVVITHYQRLLDYIRPDRVHVLAQGRIVRSGGPELAADLEKGGYEQFVDAA